MSRVYTRYGTTASPMWKDCPWLPALEDPSIGFGFHDDFLKVTDIAPAAAGTESGYLTTASGVYFYFVGTDTTAASIVNVDDAIGGAIKLSTGAQDNQVAQMGWDQAMCQISDAETKRLWFEAKFKLDSIADNDAIAFVGLGTKDSVTTEELLLTDAGALRATGGYIGFLRPEGDGDGLDFIYQAASQTQQVKIADMATLVADTYVTCGFFYDGYALEGQRVSVWLNGAEQTTYVTAANIAAATFPDAEPFGLVAGIKAAEATNHSLTMDYWRLFAER